MIATFCYNIARELPIQINNPEGNADLVTFMWCNECFDPANPDTYFLNVEETVDE